MGWIKNRIDVEYRKHYRVTGGCDWSKIAEIKIISTIKSLIDEAPDIDYVGEYLKEKLILNEIEESKK